MTEGGKNYKLDELISYYLIYLHYINNSTNPSLTFDMSKYGHRKLKTEYEKQLQNYYA